MAVVHLPPPLDAPVSRLKDVGETAERRLAKLGIKTVRDLLLTLPFAWETYGGPTGIASLTPGVQATVVGRVVKIGMKFTKFKKMRLTEATIEDDTNQQIRVAWFNNRYVINHLHEDDRVALAGM